MLQINALDRAEKIRGKFNYRISKSKADLI